MVEYLELTFSMPVLAFTVPLAVASLYWVVVIFSGLDFDVFGGGGEGLAEGAMEGLAEGAAEGLAEGAVEAGAHGLVGGHEGVEVGEAADGVFASVSALALVAAVLRFGKVPATVAISAFLLWSWCAAYLMSWSLRHGLLLPLPSLVLSTLTIVAAVVAGGALTNLTVRPIEGLFQKEVSRARSDLFGEVCVLRTGSSSASFGQAELHVGHDVLRIDVRCDRPDNALKRGDEALIVSFDEARRAYVIEPLAAVEGELQQRGVAGRSAQRTPRRETS
jgi:hypothetical protein